MDLCDKDSAICLEVYPDKEYTRKVVRVTRHNAIETIRESIGMIEIAKQLSVNVPGSYCGNCELGMTCDARRMFARELNKGGIKGLEMLLKDDPIDEMSNADLAEIHNTLKAIKSLDDDVMAVMKERVINGQFVPGYKLTTMSNDTVNAGQFMNSLTEAEYQNVFRTMNLTKSECVTLLYGNNSKKSKEIFEKRFDKIIVHGEPTQKLMAYKKGAIK
jgi:hypothetical protein